MGALHFFGFEGAARCCPPPSRRTGLWFLPPLAALVAATVIFDATPALAALKQGCSCPQGTQPAQGENQTNCRNQQNQLVAAICTNLGRSTEYQGPYSKLVYLEAELAQAKDDLRNFRKAIADDLYRPTMDLDFEIEAARQRTIYEIRNEIAETIRENKALDSAIQSRSHAPRQYAPLISRRDPVSRSLGTAPEGFPPVEASFRRREAGAGISVFGGTDVSRQTASSLSGSTLGGLPASIGGFSVLSTTSGAALRFDLTGPLNLAPGQRFAVVAGVRANTNSLNYYGGFGLGGLASPGGASGSGVSLGGGARYSFGPNYVVATGVFNTGGASVSANEIGTLGRFGTQGYAVDLAAGRYFGLWSTKETGAGLLADGWKGGRPRPLRPCRGREPARQQLRRRPRRHARRRRGGPLEPRGRRPPGGALQGGQSAADPFRRRGVRLRPDVEGLGARFRAAWRRTAARRRLWLRPDDGDAGKRDAGHQLGFGGGDLLGEFPLSARLHDADHRRHGDFEHPASGAVRPTAGKTASRARHGRACPGHPRL